MQLLWQCVATERSNTHKSGWHQHHWKVVLETAVMCCLKIKLPFTILMNMTSVTLSLWTEAILFSEWWPCSRPARWRCCSHLKAAPVPNLYGHDAEMGQVTWQTWVSTGKAVAYLSIARTISSMQPLILFWASRWVMPSVGSPSIARIMSPMHKLAWAALLPGVTWQSNKSVLPQWNAGCIVVKCQCAHR